MPPTERRRRAFTLVEVIAATAIMATLTAASFALVRTSHNAWLRHREDSGRRREAIGAVQHIVRRVRQASRVTAISAASDASGSLTLLMSSGAAAVWDHDSATNRIFYGTSTANNLLASGIAELSFTAYKANGTATTTDVTLIHSVRCTVKYALARPSGSVTETISCVAWLRTW